MKTRGTRPINLKAKAYKEHAPFYRDTHKPDRRQISTIERRPSRDGIPVSRTCSHAPEYCFALTKICYHGFGGYAITISFMWPCSQVFAGPQRIAVPCFQKACDISGLVSGCMLHTSAFPEKNRMLLEKNTCRLFSQRY